jgi:diguanylate cyclase (GGDEF)-like protein
MRINFHSITVKTVILITIFSLAFILFVTFVVRNLFTDSYMDLEKDKVALISEYIAAPLSLNLSYGFDEAITEISTKALSNKNILLVEVKGYNNQSTYTFSDYNLTIEDHIKNHELIDIRELKDPGTKDKVGKLTIVYSNDSYEEYVNNFNIWFFWGIFGFIISLFILGYFLYKSLKNLSILDESLKNFDPENPIRLNLLSKKNDEIHSISKSANIMIDNIVEYISQSKELTSKLLNSQHHLKDAQRMAKVGSIDYNVTTQELILSDEYYRILGVKLNTYFTFNNFLSLIDKNDYERVRTILDNAILNGSQFSIKYRLILNNGKEIYIHTNGKVRKKKGSDIKLTAVSMDITNDVKSKKTIEKLAYFDALTGLANRTLLKDRMLKAIQRAKRIKEKIAVIFLDLDHFKLINDTLGHSVGDELLIHIANILKAHTRVSDTISRLGGDEFVILLPSIKTVADVEKFAIKIQKSLEHKHNIGTHQLYITSSIGVAVYPDNGENSDELIRNADTAMYEAKNDGRNKYKMYSAKMGNIIDKQLHLEQDLTDAVKNTNQIQVYYQPKIDTKSKKIIGAEALVRWNHPVNGLIFPDEFIYMAESTGLMIELGNLITDQSIAMVKELNELGFKGMKIAINLSARQFQDDGLIPSVLKTLKKYDIDPSQIEFEITETISMSNMTNTLRILTVLRDIGVSIAIDDFGTGYSSLAYLKKFPINILKIDRSFIMDIVEDEDDRVIAQTIISMAHSLGLKTVAEGVETQEHVNMLEDMDCDMLQGYFYSKPIDKDAFIKLIKN